jgi:hypothetical protein
MTSLTTSVIETVYAYLTSLPLLSVLYLFKWIAHVCTLKIAEDGLSAYLLCLFL